MADIPTLDRTYVAAADLRTKQYHLVEFVGDRTVNVCNAVTDRPCGILQNKPDVGQAAVVRVAGVSPCVVGASVAAGDLIGPTSTGRGEPKTTASHWFIGIAEEGITLPATPTGSERVNVRLTGPARVGS